MMDLAPWAWVLLAVGSAVAGFSKTAVPGGGTVTVALFAAALPARTSTATVLLLFIVGDIFALIAYRRHAHWPTLLRLAPAVVAGLALGLALLYFGNDSLVRRSIGVILLTMIAVTMWRRRAQRTGSGPLLAATYGTLAGFTTMVANAGGPVMSMYFIATRAPVQVFLGTAAWFFAIVNLVKVPFLAGIGLMTSEVLLTALVLAPLVALSALAGMRVAKRMPQALFDRLVITLTVLGAAYLLF